MSNRKFFQDARLLEACDALQRLTEAYGLGEWPVPDYHIQMDVARASRQLSELLKRWGYQHPRKAA